MKRFLPLLLVFMMLSLSVFCVSAETTDVADTGKTIISDNNWVYESIEGGKYWELDEYLGNGGDIIIPRIVNDMMVTTIGNHCFVDNTTVRSVITSSPLWTVGEYAFLNCTSLESFECNFALKEIGVGAFSGTTSLKNINLEDSVVEVINPHVFMGSGVAEVILPDTCTEIMHDAFSQCPNLKMVLIPRSVVTIDDDAFSHSDNVVIYCYSGSAAHTYAAAKGIDYVLLDTLTDTYLRGDSDGNENVDVVDATWIQRFAAHMDIAPVAGTIAHGDIDGDNEVTVIDATYILRYSVSIPTPYSVGERVFVF